MADKTLKTKILLRNDLQANWEKSSVVLGKGELAWANDTGVFKIGDGEHTWAQISLIYKDWASVETAIEEAVAGLSKTNITELDVTKGADHAIALATIENPEKGDIAIVKELIVEGKKQYTAYVYTGSVWAAMDGNYSAENVYFDKDITATYQFGKYKPDSTGSVSIPANGKSLAGLFIDSFAEAKDPTVTQPSVSISLTNGGAKEAGTKISPAYSVSFNKGKYEYGPDTGITATYSVTDGVEGHAAQTTATGTFGEIQVVDGMSYKASVVATHTAGAVPKNNIGVDVEAKKIAAGTKSANSGTISAFRQSFYGSVTDKNSDITSAVVRGLSGKSGKTNAAGNTFNAAEAVGAMRVIIAVPAPRTCTSIKDVNGLNAEAISAFTKITVNVEGANGYEAKAYNVYYKDNAAACDKANNWAVTLG